jgi:hypothetical protein
VGQLGRTPNYGAFGANQGFFSTGYRPGGNASRSWDLDEVYYDAHGNAGVYGRLPTGRPHVFKFYGSKTFKTGTEIGGFYRIMSGTPITTLVATMNDIPLMVEGRGDAGRNPVFSQTDLLVAQEFKFGEVKRLRFEFNASNLFNQKTNMYTFQNYNREDLYDTYGIDLSGTDLNKGFDWKSMVNALGSGARDPRFGKAAWFNPGFAGRVMVKFIFQIANRQERLRGGLQRPPLFCCGRLARLSSRFQPAGTQSPRPVCSAGLPCTRQPHIRRAPGG